MPFSKFGLSDQLVQGILASGYTTPTPIQSLAIPPILAGKDLIGCAQTGTGKTAAFVLPMLHRLTQTANGHTGRHIKALILTPTRELTQQVEEYIGAFSRSSSIQSLAVFGGVNMENQIKRLRRGVDIVVATPGRLIDHLNRRTIDLSKVEILVLDEADRMFDMGFINDVRTIVARVPKNRQTLMFSATMSKEIRALVTSIQKDPEFVEVGERRRPVETVTQYFYHVPHESKMALLQHILQSNRLESVLVFSRTKHGADKISRRLERSGVKSIAIHSNRTQAQRQRALAGFKQGQYAVLVATDVAARGIDVDGISHVINYDIPAFAEDYIHRIGRTARAGAKGDAITFVSNQERKQLRSIEHFVGRRYELKEHPGFDPSKTKPTESPVEESVGKKKHAPAHPQNDPSRKPRHAPKHKVRNGGHPNRSFQPKRKQVENRVLPAGASLAPAGNADWRSLISADEGNQDGFRKKIKRLFKRD